MGSPADAIIAKVMQHVAAPQKRRWRAMSGFAQTS